MVGAGMYVRNICKLVLRDDEGSLQSRKSHIYADADCSSFKVGVASFPSNAYPAESRSIVPDSDSESSSNVEEQLSVKVDTDEATMHWDHVQPIKVYIAVLWASASDKNAGNCMPAGKSGRGNHKLVEIVANHDQIMEQAYSKQEILDKFKE